MAEIGRGEIIRRKLARGTAARGDGGGAGADQGWRLAFARALRDTIGLHVTVNSLRQVRRGLVEVLDLPPDRALIALLDGPEGGLGMIVLSPDLMAAMIEMQTIGRTVAQAPPLRRPTRTDAAMVVGPVDRALAELEAILAEEADFDWAGGFRYASFLEDPRPLGLLLEDQLYRCLTMDLSLTEGARRGQVLLILPAEGRARHAGARRGGRGAAAPGPEPAGFSGALGEAVLSAGCVLEAQIGRIALSLREVMALTPGQVLPMTGATLDRITLAGLDGRTLAQARLGQHRGMRALRLTGVPHLPEASAPGAMPASPPALLEPDPALPLRAAG